jgi:hypothetical protein
LQTYASLAAANLFHPCYAQLRRIVTCGQLLVLCHTACELGRREAEELFGVFLALVREHVGMFEYVTELITSFEAVGAFLGLAMPPVRTAAAAGDAVGAAAGTPGMRGLLPVAFEPFAIHPYSAAPSPGFGFGSLGYDPWRSLGFLGLGEIGMNGC